MRNLLSSVKKKTIENRNKTSRNCISITKELARLVEEEEEEEVNEEGFNIKSSAPSHTHGVQPLGNLYLNTGSTNSRDTGLGNLHTLSDDLVLDILGFLDASSLGILATVSKSFYVFTNHEPLLEESRIGESPWWISLQRVLEIHLCFCLLPFI